MNSYALGINGSWLLAIFLILLSTALSIYTYNRTIPPISGRRRLVLIFLRSLALALLLFVIFEPVISLVRGTEIEPKTAILLDNSISAGASDAKINRKDEYYRAIDNSNITSLAKDSYKSALFDINTRQISEVGKDSVKFRGQLTDISKAIRWATRNSEEDNTRAVIMITDGAFNSGDNPIYEAESSGLPFYIIGIGDTTEPRDISIQSILLNEVAYIDNPIPVNVNVKVSGYPAGALKIDLLDNEQKISEQIIKNSPDRDIYTTVFEYLPKTEGMHRITAAIGGMEGELTSKNNKLSEFVDVLRNKRRILIFAGSSNSDISFFRNAVNLEKGIEITSFIQKKGPEFYDRQPTQADLSQAELIALIGFPVNTTSASTINMIKSELERGKSLLFISSYQTDYNKLKTLEEYLPFVTISSRQQEFLAVPDVKPASLSNPLLRINGTDEDYKLWNQLPPVFRTETFVRVKPESEVASGFKVNNVPLKEPLILNRSFQNKKSVSILAYGLYRWKLLGYAADVSKGRTEAQDLYTILMQNIIKWLSVTESNKLVKVKTTKKIYTAGEKVEFTGQSYDASYSTIDNATITIKISGNKDTREIILNSIGNGRYTGAISGLPEGDYAFNADARLNGTALGSDKGRFYIGDVPIEYQNLKMNIQLLRTVAERSGGRFYTAQTSDKLLTDLRKNKMYAAQSVSIKSEFGLWNLPWILAISILLFAIEWFIRKRSGMI